MMSESGLAHRYLDGLKGIEIGGASHNPFNIPGCINVDYAPDTNNGDAPGTRLKVDVVAEGDCLPFADESLDYVLSSHVLEHFFDPIKTLKEWWRVIRPGGYIFMIVPHMERTFDRNRPRTTLDELIKRHNGQLGPESIENFEGHYSFWKTWDVVQLCDHLGYTVSEFHDVDDKVGNGFCVVCQKLGA